MADLNFPSNPQVGDTYTIGNRTWVWNGYGWQLQSGVTSYDPFTANRVVVSTSTNSTSTNTGGLVVNGGAGINKDLWLGGNLFEINTNTTATIANLVVTNSTFIDGKFTATNFTTTQLAVTGDTVLNRLTASTSTLTSLTVETNELVKGNLTVQGIADAESVTAISGSFTNITVSGVTNSINSASGALTVAGGVGVAKDLNLGGQLKVWGPALFQDIVTFTGSATYVLTTNTVYTDNLIELHTPPGGVSDSWLIDDGKDIGIRMHYFNAGTDTNAALILANDTKMLEWYQSGAESIGSGTFGGRYGGMKLGFMWINSTTSAVSTGTGALIIRGGVGVGQQLYAQELYDNNSRVITQATLGTYGVSNLIAGTDTAVSTSTGPIVVWNTSTLQTITDRGAITTNVVRIANGTASTGTSSGALLIDGGVGVGGYLYAPSLYDSNKRVVTEVIPYAGTAIGIINTTSVGPQVSFTVVNEGVTALTSGTDIRLSNVVGNVTINNISTLQSVTSRGSSTNQIVYFSNTTNSVDVTTGAVVITGGLGVGENLYANAIYDNNSRVITQATLGNYGVSILTAGTDTAVSTGTGEVTIWSTSDIQSVTERGSYTNQIVYFTNTSDSTSNITGAVQISGGLGVNYSGFFGKNLIVDGFSNTISTNTGALQVTGGVGIGKNIFVGGTAKIAGTTVSFGTNTGALTVAGGMGVGETIHAGGAIFSSGTVVLTSATLGNYFVGTNDIAIAVDASTGILTFSDTSTLQSVTDRGSTTTNAVRIANTFSSTSTYTGQAFIVDGGASADIFYAKTMAYIDGAQVLTTLTGILSQFDGGVVHNPITIATGTNSASTTTGALVVEGGVGIAKDLYVGGNATFLGNITALTTGTQIYFNSTITSLDTPVLNLGTGAGDEPLYINDGYDRGILLHYSTTATSNADWENHAFMGFEHSTGKFVFKNNIAVGVERQNIPPVFTGLGTYGDAEFGSLLLINTTPSVSTGSGALVVAGGVGVAGHIRAGNIYDNNNRVITSFNVLAGTGLSGGGSVTGPTGTVILTNTGVLSLTRTEGIELSTTTGNITVYNTGVLAVSVGTDTVISTATGYVQIWNNSTLQTITDRGFTTTNAINVVNWTTSSNTTTGALIVSGGAAIGSNLNVGGQTKFWNYTDSGSVDTGAVVINGGLGVGGTLHAGPIYDNGNRVLTSANLGSFGVTSLTAGTDTVVTTSTGEVVIWNTSTLQSITNRGAITDNAVTVNNTLTVNDVLGARVFDSGNRVVTNFTLNVGNGISGGGSIAGPNGTLAFTNTGVLSLTAGTDTVVNSTAGNITIWNTSTLQSITNRGAITSNIVTFSNTQTSASAVSGAVQVAGGVGIAKDLYVAGNISLAGTERITNTSPSTGTASGALTVAGGVGIAGNMFADAVYDQNARVVTTATIATYAVTSLTAGTDTVVSTATGQVVVWNTSTLQSITGRGAITNNAVSITNNSSSTGTATGALLVAGGVGIGGTLNSAIINTPVLTATNAVISTLSVTTNETVSGSFTASGLVRITNSTAATSTLTGALQIVGGVGVQGALYASELYDSGNRVLTQSNLGGYGVTAINAGTDTAISTATGSVTIWGTSTLQSTTDRGATTTNLINISNVTSATSTSTGALKVAGGVGVGGNLYANNLIATSGTGTTIIQAVGTAGGQDSVRLYVANTSGPIIQFGTQVVPATYGSIGAYNGFLNIQSISRNIKIFTQNNTNSIVVSATNGNVGVKTDTPNFALDIAGTLNATGNVTFPATTAATNTSSGAVQIAGGVGVGGSLYATAIFDSGSRVVTNSTIGTVAVTSLIAGTDTVVSGTTGAVTIWDNSTLQSVTSRGATTTNVVYITNTSVSTSSVAGNALQVYGGIGTNYINIVGTGWINGQQIVTTATAGAAVAQFNGGTITNPLVINSNTNATSTTTGALVVQGGAGVGGNLYVGGSTYLAGDLYVDGTQFAVNSSSIVTGDKTITLSSATTSSSLAVNSGILIGNNGTYASFLFNGSTAWTTPNALSITNSTAATSTATGAVQVAGGVGIGQNLYVSGLGTQASPATIVVGGANATTNGDAQIILGQTTAGTDFKLLVAGVDTRSDGLTANDQYIITGQRLNFFNKGNGSTYNTQVSIGASGAGSYADIVFSAGAVSGTATERLRIDGTTGWVKLPSNIASSSTATGSLIVVGGAGISGNLNVGGNVVSTSSITSLISNFSQTALTGNAIWTNGGIAGQTLYVVNTTTIGGVTSISNTTAATSTSTGALLVAGGVGVGGNLYAGNKMYAQGAEVLTTATLGSGGGVGVSSISAGTDTAVSAATGVVTIWGTSTLQSTTNRGSTTNNAITISNTTAATSTSTGALQVAGGVGIAGNIVVGAGGVQRGTADVVYSSGSFTGPGDAQASVYTVRYAGVSSTAQVLTSDGSTAGAANQVVLPNNSAYTFKLIVVAKSTGTAESGGWEFNGVITRGASAAATTLQMSNKTKIWSSNATWDANLTVDTTNGALQVTGKGDGVSTIRFVAKIETVEVTN